MEEEKIIISLGGSLIVPEEIDVSFLKEFKNLILENVSKGKKFILITGGGRVCRKYQNVAKEIGLPSNDDLDWIGVATCNLNAELIRVIFGEKAYGKVIQDLTSDFPLDQGIVIGGASAPGHSSDMDAMLAAQKIGVKKIINLSNTDYVYDSDPRTNPNAKKIDKISWTEYRRLIPSGWDPGLNSPFDPIASELAEKEGITVMTMNGKLIDNLKKCLDGGEFLGTTIY